MRNVRIDYESDETGICFIADDVSRTNEELIKRGVIFTKEPWQGARGLWLTYRAANP